MMRNNRILRMLTILTAVLAFALLFTMTALAVPEEENENDGDIGDILTPVVSSEPVPDTTPEVDPDLTPEDDPEPPAEPGFDVTLDLTPDLPEPFEPIPLTPPGNLSIVDDISGRQSSDKQIITVVTKSGNYFYIIVDRAGDRENVYFLNLVDEADLMAIIDNGNTQPQMSVTPEPVTTAPVTAPEPEPGPVQEENGIGGMVVPIVLFIAVGGGVLVYFKVIKPKKAPKGGAPTKLDEFEFDADEDEFVGVGAGYGDGDVGADNTDDGDQTDGAEEYYDCAEEMFGEGYGALEPTIPVTEDPEPALIEAPTPDSPQNEYGDLFSVGANDIIPDEQEREGME